MPDLSLAQRFGSSVIYDASQQNLIIKLSDFQNTDSGGNIADGLGIDSIANLNSNNIDENASLILYALLVLNQQNQGANINENPDERIYITDSTPRVGTGSRTGQLQTTKTLNIFDTSSSISSTPDIDSFGTISNDSGGDLGGGGDGGDGEESPPPPLN